MYVNGAEHEIGVVDEFFYDSVENPHQTGDGFSGFLYSVTIYRTARSDFNIVDDVVCPNGCVNCPADTCLINCEFEEFVNTDDNSCGECRDDCESGCIGPDNCNVCFSSNCLECVTIEGDCITCIENAEPDPDNPGSCRCIEDGVLYAYDIEQHICEPLCHITCAECTQPLSNLYCTECKGGFFLQPEMDSCLDGCPTGTDEGSTTNSCDGDLLDDSVCLDLSMTTTHTDTQPLLHRGHYFNGTSSRADLDIFMNSTFTLTFWIRMYNTGSIFFVSTEDFSSEDAARNFETTAAYSIIHLGQTFSHDSVENQDNWHMIAVVATWTRGESSGNISLLVDGVTILSEIMENPFFDSTNNKHIIGAQKINLDEYINYFEGYIWQMCVYQYELLNIPDLIDNHCAEDWTCTSCAKDAPCLVNCLPSEGYDETGCVPCLDECDFCYRGTDCNLCVDPLCTDCPGFEGCEVDGCSENAQLDEKGVCDCDESYVAVGTQCEACADACLECNAPDDNTECSGCKEGTVLLHAICLPQCPSGIEVFADTNECNEQPVQVVRFEFNDQRRTDFVSGSYTAQGGSTPDTGDIEDDDPLPVYKRGLWFDGEDAYLSIQDLRLNFNFALEFWLRPLEFSSSSLGIQTLYSVENTFELRYNGGAFEVDSKRNGLTVSQPVGDFSPLWVNLAVSGVFSDVNEIRSTDIAAYRNNEAQGSQTLDSGIIDESGSVTVGRRAEGDFYTGFMYMVSLYTYKPDFIVDYDAGCISSFECTACPPATCVSNCEWDEAIQDDGSCSACEPQCEHGCLNTDNCSLCVEETCLKC